MDDKIVRAAQKFLDSITFTLKEQPQSLIITKDFVNEVEPSSNDRSNYDFIY